MARLSTHVLDTSRGVPGAGIRIELHRVHNDGRLLIASAVTNADGRTDAPLLAGDRLDPGVYELTFFVGDYFARTGVVLTAPPFLGDIVVRVGIADASGNYHVPLLLSPFGYSTYRGILMAVTASDVIDWCRRLAQCSEESGQTTRTFLSGPMRQVHGQLSEWMQRAGMTVRIDAVGNLRGELRGTASTPRRLYLGSHLDTVPNAGAFDGILGVVLAIALVERLGGRRLPYDVEVVGFSEEEGVRFALPFIGSRGFVGSLDAEMLSRRDAAGHTVTDAIRAYGLDPGQLGEARVGDKAIGYLEFHIEQGPVLDTHGLPVAIVDAIVGQSRVSVYFEGAANHAGTTPMDLRRDALAGAAEWIGAVERYATAVSGLVATVGRIEATPGAVNVIAGTCRASLDVRHADDRVRLAATSALLGSAREIAARRQLVVTADTHLDQPAIVMDPALVARLDRSVIRAGRVVHHMTSGAGHDAMIVSDRMPVAMLFLRSPGGISHHPDESVTEDAVTAALAVGREFMEDLAREHHG